MKERLTLLLEVFEDEADDYEVGGDGDAEHGEGGQNGGNAHPEEEVEEAQLQEIVEDVGAGKACTVAGIGVLAEREVGGEVVVGKETDDIADGEGDVEIDEILQEPVDGVMDGDSQDAHYPKAEQLAKGLRFCQFFDFHGAKVLQTERNTK